MHRSTTGRRLCQHGKLRCASTDAKLLRSQAIQQVGKPLTRSTVKKDIHPKYVEAVVACACGNTFKTRATQPQINVEICSSCHPFFTGKQKFIDSEGRVERFQKKYAQVKAGKN